MKKTIGLLICMVLASSVHGQDWPTFRKDNARSGLSEPSIKAERLEQAWMWRSELPPDPAWDGPARWDAYAQIRDLPAMRQYDACFHPVSDGELIFFGSSSQDTLTSLRLENGETQWSFVAGGPIRLAPTIEGHRVLFGCDDGYVYCVNKLTGALLWKFSPSVQQNAEQRRLINNDRLISYYPIRTGVTVEDGLAYFGASFLPWRESYICAVDAETGKLNKSKNTYVVKHDKATLEGSLLVAENRLIVPQGRVAPLIFDRSTGKSLGRLPGGGGIAIVLTETGDVARSEGGRAARSGQVGVYQGKKRVASFPRGRSLVIRDDRFYVIDGEKLFAADRNNNALIWSRDVDEPLELIIAGNTVFVGGRDHVTGVNADTGNVTWSATTEGRVFGLAVAGKKLLASTDTGRVYAFAPTAQAAWASSSTHDPIWNSPSVARVREKNLLHRWVFHRSAMNSKTTNLDESTQLTNVGVKDQAGDSPLLLQGKAESILVGKSESVEALAMKSATFPIDPSMIRNLPSNAISVEAWVRVDQPTTWGGIVGCIQDDGSTEHGWLLGYRDDKFCFALAGGGNGLTYLTANNSFQLESWNHVVGTYDGRQMRLYINGSLAANSDEEKGPIDYAGEEHFTVGAYKDANESYPLQGALHEVRIYSAPLEGSIVAKKYANRSREFESLSRDKSNRSNFVSWGPITRFVSPGTIEISYGTTESCASVVDLISGSSVKRFSASKKTRTHRMVVDQLPRRRELQFQIRQATEESAESSESYSIDTHFDWTDSLAVPTSSETNWITELIEDSPNPRGLAIVVGADQILKAQQLATHSQLTVVLVVEDETQAQAIRQSWLTNPKLRYGREISVTTTPLRQLPAACASVVLTARGDEVHRRLVRPQGGIMHDGNATAWKRKAVEGSGEWSHMYGQADNSAFGGEQLSNASGRQDLMTQWIGRPGPRYQTDRQNRKPSPLAAGGRLFLQGQQRMIALDSYSGTVLWSVESPTVMRWNVPHDCSNWCADTDGVFVAAENQAWFLDGRSGDVKKRIDIPMKPENREGLNWGYISRYQDQLIGSAVQKEAIYTKWWGKTQWFDSTGGADTHVVAADQIFSVDPKTGDKHWIYEGLILHPTITILDDQLLFVEDKTPDHLAARTRRISLKSTQQHELVCLDVVAGKTKWRRPLAPFAGHVAVLYLAGGGDDQHRSLVFVASESTLKEFSVRTFDLKNGTPKWKKSVTWEANHHGKHISRPAIQGELLYLRPEVMNLADGKTIRRGFPGGHGCASYSLSTNGLFARLGETTWWDVRNNKVNRFDRIRTDCWISVVPAQGMLLSAEGGGGCSCGTWLETSLGFLPRSVDESLPEE